MIFNNHLYISLFAEIEMKKTFLEKSFTKK